MRIIEIELPTDCPYQSDDYVCQKDGITGCHAATVWPDYCPLKQAAQQQREPIEPPEE